MTCSPVFASFFYVVRQKDHCSIKRRTLSKVSKAERKIQRKRSAIAQNIERYDVEVSRGVSTRRPSPPSHQCNVHNPTQTHRRHHPLGRNISNFSCLRSRSGGGKASPPHRASFAFRFPRRDFSHFFFVFGFFFERGKGAVVGRTPSDRHSADDTTSLLVADDFGSNSPWEHPQRFLTWI